MKVLLGICGGIAAYKAAELTRELRRRGAEVQIVMTASAEKFITPLTLAALSGQQVVSSLWEPSIHEEASEDAASFEIEHIRMAQEADVLVIAPATANFMAKLAHGIADDLLLTICLASKAPLCVAPAMNVNMWHHPATAKNREILQARGIKLIEPGSGYLACGMVGEGRLADPVEIADATYAALQQEQDLAGETILITAGGTREAIDPVRYIGNRSSGKMGFALASAAARRGAQVILITAATVPEKHAAWSMVQVETAEQMHREVLQALPQATVVIMAAAVSDYRVKDVAPQKLKKQDTLQLELVRNQDILQNVVSQRRHETLVIGFAAETENLRQEARKKLHAKGVDAIMANDVSHPESGFDVDRNGGIFLTQEREIEMPNASKLVLANNILDQIASLHASRLLQEPTRSSQL